MSDGQLGWLPPNGVRLTTEEVATMLDALRAILDGTDRLEPNKSHAMSVAFTLIDAIGRSEGAD